MNSLYFPYAAMVLVITYGCYSADSFKAHQSHLSSIMMVEGLKIIFVFMKKAAGIINRINNSFMVLSLEVLVPLMGFSLFIRKSLCS